MHFEVFLHSVNITVSTAGVAGFNDTKCESGEYVCPDDALLYTCNLTDLHAQM